MTINKSMIKIGLGILSFSLFLSFPASALCWPFSGYGSQKNSDSVGSKEDFESCKEKLEATKNNYKDLDAQIGDIITQLEGVLKDFKNSRASFVEQMDKLDSAYKEWSEKDYPLKGESYEKFVSEKEQLDKVACLLKINEGILKTFFDNLSVLAQKDTSLYKEYKTGMSQAINAYYRYGFAVAQGTVNAV